MALLGSRGGSLTFYFVFSWRGYRFPLFFAFFMKITIEISVSGNSIEVTREGIVSPFNGETIETSGSIADLDDLNGVLIDIHRDIVRTLDALDQ